MLLRSGSKDRDLSFGKAGQEAWLRRPISSECKRRLKRGELEAESCSMKPKGIRKDHTLRYKFSKHGNRVAIIEEKAGARRSTSTKKKKQGNRKSVVQGPARWGGTAIFRFSLIQLSKHIRKSFHARQNRQSTRVSRTGEGISASNNKAQRVDGITSVSKTSTKKKSDKKSARQTGIPGVTDAELYKHSTISVHAEQNTQSCRVTGEDEGIFVGSRKFVVHISRQEEVEIVRRKLPILMMEQEIMEAIIENPVSIVCGETGCGKTTQVPQFLYEAGFSSSKCNERSGIIGVTQPRRVAVLATAKRVSHEMNLRLGQEVGFQVRHDRNVGEKTRIKFMTDGILLREIQSDFLLQKYSVIVLDEAHERSLNTDILIGMLSRILPLRQSLFEEHCNLAKSGRRERSGACVFPLKLIIMSATLRIDDFISNRRLFVQPPPVVQVPARQFPVTVHFSAKTELIDYVGKAYKKVCSIHKNLPPGGVLVFVTSQAEVNYLCRRLQKAFSKFANWKENNKGQKLPSMPLQPSTSMRAQNGYIEPNINSSDIKMEDILKAGDGGYGYDDFEEEFEADDQKEISNSTADSSSESDEGILNLTDVGQEGVQNDRSFFSPVLLDAIRGAFDAFDGCNTLMAKTDQNKNRLALPKVAGPLYVLPLYAMLPAALQLRVFGAVPEGSRLVVVATNVAETSITIPGIRYVVDCGRFKEKMYERASGINRYEVHWISKASAAQRAGRAGRTGPGHCYRLYSSAVFNDIFPEFFEPEICRAAIEGLVLLLKSMGITNVSNFPFPTPPDKQALVEAERCLQALSVLDSKSGLLTPLGEAMSVYPIGPRHSRMLLTAMQHECACNTSEAYRLLAYAAAAAAALSLDSPFIVEREARGAESRTFAGDADAENIISQSHESEPMPKLIKNVATFGDQIKFCYDSKEPMQARFRHPFSDALSAVTALRAYEGSKDPEDFCKRNYLHARIMHEMSKLRKQLIHLYLFSASNSCIQGNTPTSGGDVNHAEFVWREQGTQGGVSVKHEQLLRQAICAGWADRVARKISLQEMEKSRGSDEHRKHNAIQYRTCTMKELVCLHPSSSVRKVAPEFVVYNEIVNTSRPYMRNVTSVDAHWLVLHANALCTFSKPLSDPPPWYDPFSDDVFCFVSPRFGPHLWELPLHRLPLKTSTHRIAVFACALLKGKVLPCMASLHPHLRADPSTLLVPAGHAQTRVSELVHVLRATAVDNRRKLKAQWEAQPGFLFQEILLWVQKDYHSLVGRLWSQLKQEAQQDGGELFKTDRQKLHSERGRAS